MCATSASDKNAKWLVRFCADKCPFTCLLMVLTGKTFTRDEKHLFLHGCQEKQLFMLLVECAYLHCDDSCVFADVLV